MTLTAGNLVLANPMVCTNTAKGDNKLYSDAKGVVPSLDLRFASQKNLNDYITGQNLITFSRPVGANQSPGTYVDENGIIQLSSANQPRFDHDPTTGESLGLLIEDSRTNILLNSATLSTQSVTTSATAYALSFYGTGTVTLSGTSNAGPLTGTGANDRVTLTFTPTAGTLTLTITGTVSNAQLEEGSFPTSYIPTTGTALTRSADNASITGADFSSWFNSPEGTLFTDLQTANTSCFGWNVSDGSNNNRFVFDPGVNTGTAAAVVSGGATTFGAPPTVLAGGGKIAFAYKPNDCGVYGNQTQLVGISPAAVPTGLNQIGLGYRGNYAPDAFLNGTISRLTYWPERLADATLQAITA